VVDVSQDAEECGRMQAQSGGAELEVVSVAPAEDAVHLVTAKIGCTKNGGKTKS